jgi:hypothetical protein
LDPQELLAYVRKPQSPPVATLPPKDEAQSPVINAISASHHAHPTPEGQQSPTATSDAAEQQSEPLPQQHITASELNTSVHAAAPPENAIEGIKSECERAQTPTEGTGDHHEADHPSESGRKRGHAEMSHEDAPSSQAPPSSAGSLSSKKKDPLKRSSSVRLSMTADGAVKIRTGDSPSSSPSPPKERALPPSDARNTQTKRFRRSISLFEDHTAQKPSNPAQTLRLDPGFGRSRDARTWEFYCDSSSKDALSTQVEAERNGSAVGAINLIRSNSNKARGPALSDLGSRGNIQLAPARLKGGKPKMERTKSSFARLQHVDVDTSALKPTKGGGRHVRSPSGDSDKENWAPNTRMSTNPLRRTQPTNNRRPILQSSDIHDVRSTVKAPATKSSKKDNAGGDDLDCIQGLLSLSQGAWS